MQDNLYTSSFKTNIKFIIKVFIFILCLIPMTMIIGKKYSSASTENIINGFNKKRFEDFYSLPKNSLDMVFLGSSHSYCTFDPEIFDNKLNTNSFQLGMPLQHPDSTYYTLKEVLNYQKPKIVVMEVYWDLLKNGFELNQVKTLFQVLNNETLKDEYIKEDFPLSEKIKYNVNVLKYQADYFAYKGNEYNNKIKNKFNVKDKETKKQIGTEEYRSKGYVYSDYKMLQDEYNKTNQFKNLDGKNFEFSENQKYFLEKIINLCKENNIELIFVTAPIANVSMDYIKNYNLIHDKVANFAKKHNIFYIDYNIINKQENLLTNDNFRDDAHLNHSGVEIISNHFINILKENNIIS
mgnify:FL=1